MFPPAVGLILSAPAERPTGDGNKEPKREASLRKPFGVELADGWSKGQGGERQLLPCALGEE